MYERGTRPRPVRATTASRNLLRRRGIVPPGAGTRRWLVLSLGLLVQGCGGDDDEGPRFAGITFDGRCGPHAALELWRPGAVSPLVVGLEGLRCRVVEGELPAGMRLDPETCAISGTPLRVESQDVRIRASARNAAGTVDEPCALDVLGPALGYVGLGAGIRRLPGDAFSEPPASARPRRWAPADGESLVYEVAAGTLPPGLSLDAATGVISGTLTWPAGSHTERWWPFTIRYTASGPLGTVDGDARSGVLVRLPALDYGPARRGIVGAPLTTGRPAISPPLPDAAATFAYALDAWAPWVEARLPPGLRLDPATGEISGTPAAPDEAWTGVTLTVTRNGVAFPLLGAVQLRVVR